MAPGKARMLGTNLTTAADGENGAQPGQDDGEDIEAEVCFICASPVVHNAVAPCNHRTCHICSLRLRALYKTKACAHCRVSGIGPKNSLLYVTILLTSYIVRSPDSHLHRRRRQALSGLYHF